MRPNLLKAKFARGEVAYGVNLMFPSVQLVETFALLGFDWVLLDCEHGAISFESLDALTMAADAAGITPIVRPPNNDDASILRALDRGAVVGDAVAHGAERVHVGPVGRRIENLGQSAPSDIANQRGFFLLSGRSVFGLNFTNQFYRGEIGAALFLWRTCANAIGGGNTVIVLIAGYSFASGGRRMYSSRTISQARSFACCAVNPCF